MPSGAEKKKKRKPPAGCVWLPSGSLRARWLGPDGKRRSATFKTVEDAKAWLAVQQADSARGTWKPPERGTRTVGEYAADHIESPRLRESTRALYASLWRLHLADTWTDVPVGKATPAQVRAWHTRVGRTTGATATAQAYRLLRAIFTLAVKDEVIDRNPCRMAEAANPVPTRESRALSPADVRAIADGIPDRYRALVMVLAWGGLRFGEATELRRRDVAGDGSEVQISRSQRNGVVGLPKTTAGTRPVAMSGKVAEALTAHLLQYVPADPDALVFGTANGTHLARQNFTTMFHRAVKRAGLPPTRVHELRHTGATAFAQAGATTAELMKRFGHATPVAALAYQHAASQRDRQIADAMDAAIDA